MFCTLFFNLFPIALQMVGTGFDLFSATCSNEIALSRFLTFDEPTVSAFLDISRVILTFYFNFLQSAANWGPKYK